MRGIFRWSLLAVVCAAAAATAWPTRKWREAPPETQGIDSQALANVIDEIAQKHPGVHSLLIVRHGVIVLDAYFYPFRAGEIHDMASVTKSITSTLVGIAVSKGTLKTDQRLLSFFPKEQPPNPDPRERQITVDNVLTMKSGLDCGFTRGEQELETMRRSADWVQNALALPMRNPPGTQAGYCSPGYHLLSSIITAATGQSELDFARKQLFGPLGIKDVVWLSDPQGRTHGWGDSHFYPRDVAKIGYLYLHGGAWDGKQIVPTEWLKQYSEGQNPQGFGASGRGGQSLRVSLAKDMIVVMTGGGYSAGPIAQMIDQSIKSDQPLPPNPEAVRHLQVKVADAARSPGPGPASPLPAIAASVSGAVYSLPRNPSRLDSVSLTFKGQTEAQLKVKYLGDDYNIPVGLNGVYRISPNGPAHLLCGAMGNWTSDGEFVLDLNFIGNINHYTLHMRFAGGTLEATIDEASGLVRNGHVTGTR